MAAKNLATGGVLMSRQMKFIQSTNEAEARRNVRALYRQWMKGMPEFLHHYGEHLDRSKYEIRLAFKRQFYKNAHVKDLRVVDRLIYEGEKEFWEIRHMVTPSYTIMNRLFEEHVDRKPTDFLSKFFAGKN